MIYNIAVFAQMYNELKKSNLQRFLRNVKLFTNNIFIYDDCSNDGSFEYVLKFTPYIIKGEKNEFNKEIFHKQQLLEFLKQKNKEDNLKINAILWLDFDEVCSKPLINALQNCCNLLENGTQEIPLIDGIAFPEINLWRSKKWCRTDNLFNKGVFVRLWKYKDDLNFEVKEGLHNSQYPKMDIVVTANNLPIIHYGFSSQERIIDKFITYRKNGQSGYLLIRLIDESSLEIQIVSKDLFIDNTEYNDNEQQPEKISIEDYGEEIRKVINNDEAKI